MAKLIDIETKIKDRLSIYGTDLIGQVGTTLKSKELKNTDDLFEDILDVNSWDYIPTGKTLTDTLKDEKIIPYIILATEDFMEEGCTRTMMLEYAYALYTQNIMEDDLVKIAKILVLDYIRVKLKVDKLEDKLIGLLMKTTDRFVKESGYQFCINDINDILLENEEVKING